MQAMRTMLLKAGLALLAALASGGPASAQTGADASAMPAKAAVCAACHGLNGNPSLPGIPVLAGQTARYMVLQLRDFQAGRRTDPQMSPMATDLSRDDMRALADWYAAQKPVVQPFQPDAAKARLGKAKADETLCTMCHLGGFAGQNEIPRLAGQRFDYIVKQLLAFKQRTRTNDAGNMTAVSSTLSEADIQNLAYYIASL